MSKIAVFFAEGFEEIEALTVVDICRRAGMEVDMVSVQNTEMVCGSHGIAVKADRMLSDYAFDCDGLVLPGGMPGTLNLEKSEVLMERLDAFYRTGKMIAAICAAPSIFGHRGYLEGRRACCYPGFESHLTGAEVSANEVERDDNVLTSRGMGTAIAFSLALVELFVGKEKAEDLGRGIIWNCTDKV